MNFFDKLMWTIAQNNSLLYVELNPDPDNLPERYHLPLDSKVQIEDLDEWMQLIIRETKDLVCAYKPNLTFYQALGIPGMELLAKTLASIPGNIPIILDAKHSDLKTSTVFARTVFNDWKVDACTLMPYAGLEHIAPFLVYPGKAVFILCATDNPSSGILQEYGQDLPVYLQVVQAAKTWAIPEQLGLEVGATSPEILKRVRSVTPERVILLLNDLVNKAERDRFLAAGLDSKGEGLLLAVPNNILQGDNIKMEVELLRDEINEERANIVAQNPTCELWLPDVCLLEASPHRDLILQLYDIGCIIFGDHIQSSGAIFPYYVDLRQIISQPQIFHQILTAYAGILSKLEFDRIAGIPYGSLPTATGLSLRLDRPLIFPRKEVKSYGAGRLIEGNFQEGEKIVVIDDILITGNSVMQGADKIKSAGLLVDDIVVFIDHERGVKDRLKQHGYNAHAVLTMSEIADILYQSGRIDEQQFHVLSIN